MTNEPKFNPQFEPDGSLSNNTIENIQNELYRLTDEYSIDTYPAEHRNHLGVSIIGEDCHRKLWYSFRWVKLIQHEPRIRRLFNRGHSEEEKIDKILTWMGFFVREIDPATDKQYKFSSVKGHYGGSGDGITLMPWFRDETKRILIEKKTHKSKLFQTLKAKKLKASNPKHYAQMCGYGKAFQLRYGLYIAANKDDDDIYYELIELDWNYAAQLEHKAQNIIYSKTPPFRINDDPNWYECQYCDFKKICHYNEPVEKNCRSCKFSVPIEAGQWQCTRHNSIIPKDEIIKEWKCHVPIND